MYLQLLSTLNFTKDQLSPTAQFLGMKNETAFTAITGLTYWEDGQRRNVLTAFPQGISNLKKIKKIIILRLEMERWRDTKREWQAEIDELKPSFLKCTSYTSSCLIQSLAPSLKYRNVCFQNPPHIYKFCWQPKCPSSHCEAIISLLHRDILQI